MFENEMMSLRTYAGSKSLLC